MRKRLEQAKARFEAAGVALSEATGKEFPIGRRVAVTLGNNRVVGEVVSAGGRWCYQPDRVTIRNVKTGKLRHFQAAYPGFEAVLLG